MARKIRAVVAGCGGISGAWLGPAVKIAGLEITGLVDLNEAAAKGRREYKGFPQLRAKRQEAADHLHG